MNNIPKQFICPITLTLMSDPYSDSDGNTYEKDAIFQWINQHNTSPITRNPMTTAVLVPNRAIKELINSFLGMNQSLDKNITQGQTQENDGEDIGREPVVIIAIADVSGSMDEICSNKNSTEAQNFTRLDLVKHTLNTIVNSLKSQDKLALIKFNNQATAITGIIPVNQTNKTIFLEKIDSLVADGGTNIWDALRCAINQIETNQIKSNSNVNLILFTDGESNENPPRGIIPTLKDYIANHSTLNFNIHTYGFGNNINSSLLYEISELKSGIFGFIPDSSMIGTVFINSIAKMMDDMTPEKEFNWSSENEIISNLLIDSLKIKKLGHFNESIKKIQIDNNNQNPFLNDLLIDCNDAINDSDGQIFKALSQKYYNKWGKHYILSVISAYVNKFCLNFRDHGVQHFKTSTFTKYQKDIEDVFINLNPPIPTGKSYENYGNGNGFANGNLGGNLTPNHPVTPQVFSSTFYNSSGVCFTTDTLIKIQGGTFIPVQELKKDMQIESMGEIATVICVLKTKINGPIMRMMNNPFTGITPYHPVFMNKYNNKWMFPSDMTDLYEDYAKDEYVYDYILDKHHIVELDGGIYATTLNHGRNGDVIGHDYFGTEKVLMELKQHPGWNEGFIQLDNYKFTHDETTNHINGIQF